MKRKVMTIYKIIPTQTHHLFNLIHLLTRFKHFKILNNNYWTYHMDPKQLIITNDNHLHFQESSTIILAPLVIILWSSTLNLSMTLLGKHKGTNTPSSPFSVLTLT